MPLKSAEEWANHHCKNRSAAYKAVFVLAFREIQHNALLAAAEVASNFSIAEQPIHPDIPAARISEHSKLVYHTTCQHVSQAIETLAAQLLEEKK